MIAILLLFLRLSTLSDDDQQNSANARCVFYTTIHNNCSEYNINNNRYKIWRNCWQKCWKKYHKEKKCWKRCKNNILRYYKFLNVSHIDFEYLNYSFPLEYSCDTLYPILHSKCNEIEHRCNYDDLLENITNWCVFDTKIDKYNYDILLKNISDMLKKNILTYDYSDLVYNISIMLQDIDCDNDMLLQKISDMLKTNVSLECNYMNLLTNLTEWLSENKVKEQKCNCTDPSLLSNWKEILYDGQNLWLNVGILASGVTIIVILMIINSVILCSILRKIGNMKTKIPQTDTNNINNRSDESKVTVLIDKSKNKEQDSGPDIELDDVQISEGQNSESDDELDQEVNSNSSVGSDGETDSDPHDESESNSDNGTDDEAVDN